MHGNRAVTSWLFVALAAVIAIAIGGFGPGRAAAVGAAAVPSHFGPGSPTPTKTPAYTPDARPAWCVTTPTPHARYNGVLPYEGTVSRKILHCSDDGYEVDGATRTLRVADYSFRTGAITGTLVSRVENYAGLLFRDVRIPNGAHVTSAGLQMWAWGWQTGAPVVLSIRGEKSAQALDFSTANPWPKDRPRTQAAIEWIIEGTVSGGVNSPDLAAIIEEIVAQPDWQPGNDLAILIDPVAPNLQFVDWQAYEFSQTSGAVLVADYTVVEETSTPTPTQTATPTRTATPTATASPTATPSPTSKPSGVLDVNTTSDELNSDGDCSLREAIQAANSGKPVDRCDAGGTVSEIRLPAGTFTLSLAGSGEDGNVSGDLDIGADVTLAGAGAGSTIVDAGAIDRALHILAGAHVEVRDLTVRNGSTGQIAAWVLGGREGEPGGGILNNGTLRLVRVTVTDNRTGAGNGCDDSSSSEVTGGAGGPGGGIYNKGLLTLERSTVSWNNAGSGGGAGCEVAGVGGDGGGIYNEGTLVAASSFIEQNKAGSGGSAPSSDGDTAVRGGMGGGLYNAGYAEIVDSTMRGNSGGSGGASTGQDGAGGAGGDGGAIANERSLLVSGSTLNDNAAGDGGEGTRGDHGGDGGGIANRGNAQLLNCTLTANSAGSSVQKPESSEANGAAGNGGAIENSGALQLSSCTIVQNGTGEGNLQATGRGRGGGIHSTGPAVIGNTILGENQAFAGGNDCAGLLSSQGNNLIQDVAGCTILGDLQSVVTGQSPLLQPLADNGGPTWTLALASGSPALDAGLCATKSSPATTTDQRGMTRPQGDGCDIGALEAGSFHPVFMPVVEP